MKRNSWRQQQMVHMKSQTENPQPPVTEPRPQTEDGTAGPLTVTIHTDLHTRIVETLKSSGMEGIPASWWVRKAIEEKLIRATPGVSE